MCKTHVEQQDTWHQPVADVSIVTPNDTAQHSDKGAINEAHGRQAKVHNGHMPQVVRQQCKESGVAMDASNPTISVVDDTLIVGIG